MTKLKILQKMDKIIELKRERMMFYYTMNKAIDDLNKKPRTENNNTIRERIIRNYKQDVGIIEEKIKRQKKNIQ